MDLLHNQLFWVGVGTAVASGMAYTYGPDMLIWGTKMAIGTYIDAKYWLWPQSKDETMDIRMELPITHDEQLQTQTSTGAIEHSIYWVTKDSTKYRYVVFGDAPSVVYADELFDQIDAVIPVYKESHQLPGEQEDRLYNVLSELAGVYGDFHGKIPTIDDIKIVYDIPILDRLEKIIVNTENLEEYVIQHL